MKFLLLNAGSSSLKASLVEAETGEILFRYQAEWSGRPRHTISRGADEPLTEEISWRGHRSAVEQLTGRLVDGDYLVSSSPLTAIGHRIVHGGSFSAPLRITREVREQIDRLADLAPLHNPPGLETLAAAEQQWPGVTHVAVFDTAFHATLPARAFHYPVPQRWVDEWGIRRYGFHGLSYDYCTRRAAALLDRPQNDLRLVICHLGHGCSAAAVDGGRSVDTTMGFTPLDGLMMATRSGAVDPGILLHILRSRGMSIDALEQTLQRESGLLGVSGISADMREVLAAASQGCARAELAVAIYVHRVRQVIGAYFATLGGSHALVFTAGVGENSAEIRARVCNQLDCLGVQLDAELNRVCRPDADIANANSPVRILVIATQEDRAMLRAVESVVAADEGLLFDDGRRPVD